MLVDRDVRLFFDPFLAREASVTEAAREVGCRASVMLYRVGRFVEAGLLRIVREEPRAGRAIKIYRSSHDAYLIPYALTPFASLEETLLSQFDATARRLAGVLARRLRREGRELEGYRLERHPSGEVWLVGDIDPDVDATEAALTSLADPERTLGLDLTSEFRLETERARSFQRELGALLLRYLPTGAEPLPEMPPSGDAAEAGAPGTSTFLLSVAFTPVDEDA